MKVFVLQKSLSAVPVPTTTLPPLPARRYLEPFDKDPFKDYSVDYQDVSKRTLAQQLENAKKFSRPWGPPPPEFFENNFFNPAPYKDQDPRSLLETNSIQPSYFDGYFSEDEFSIEDEETNFIEPPYPGDSNYLVEPPQLTYVEPPLMGSYQPNMGYSSVYQGGDSSNKDDEIETDIDTENNAEEDDNDYDNGGIMTPTTTPPPLLQMFPPNGLFPQKIPQMLPKQVFNDYDSLELDNKPRQREFRSVKPPTKGNYTPPPPDPKTKTSKEAKPTAVEETIKPAEKVPADKEVFSRTTTITKTTTWYLNENNDVVVKEEINGRPAPLKGKYTKTSKTTTSGPIPWYLQTYEDVIFEEENEKSKTILDKITYLKGMTPTSITSFTTAPNPWSSEVHEEVVLEEDMTKKEGINESKTASHPSPLEHIVDYLPRSQIISEEAVVEKSIIEELFEELLEEEEIVVEINLIPDLPPFAPQVMPTMKPYPQYQYPMHPLVAPQAQKAEKDNFEDGQDFIGINQNQVTTPKPLTTPPSMDNNFTPHAQITPLQGPEQQMFSQPNFNYAQTTQQPQIYGTNQPQATGNQGNRNSGKWDASLNRPLGDESQTDGSRLQARMEQDRRDKMNPQGKRQMYSQQQQQQQQQQKGMNRQGRTSRDL